MFGILVSVNLSTIKRVKLNGSFSFAVTLDSEFRQVNSGFNALIGSVLTSSGLNVDLLNIKKVNQKKI